MNEYLDADGYPTDDALERIEYWPYNECLRNIKEKRNNSYTDCISDGGMDTR